MMWTDFKSLLIFKALMLILNLASFFCLIEASTYVISCIQVNHITMWTV